MLIKTKSKKGFYFSMDAILFTSIIILTLTLTFSFYVSKAPSTSNNLYSKDLVNVLSSINIEEINNTYIESLVSSGQIKRLENSVLEQIGLFWAEGKTTLAANIIENVTDGLIPGNLNYGVYVDNEEIYSSGDINTASTLISSKKIVSGIAKDKPTLGFSAKVIFSGQQEKTISTYSYFGGFVGDGIITQYLILPNNYDNITSAYLEFAIDSDFDININDIYSGTYSNIESNNKKADKYNITSLNYQNFQPGINKVEINFLDDSKFIGGGFLKVDVLSDDVNYLPFEYVDNIITKKIYLNGINGVVNLYSSFYVPGQLNSIETFLNYTTNYPLFVGFGNITVFEGNLTEDVTITITNSSIGQSFNDSYNLLSETTTPLRIGHFATDRLGDFSRRTDSIIATDVSSSMDTEDVEDAPGQSRLDVAKTVEKNFVNFVFNKSLENRIGLVSYHSSVEPGQSEDLTNNNVTLLNKIDSYKTKSQNTCFSCAIDSAIDKLEDDGDPTKKWAVIIMSDGTADKCDSIPQSQCNEETAKNEAITYACQAFQEYNISLYSIGYGAGTDNTTLKNISEDCSDGLFFHSNNQSSLQAAFDSIAEEIMSLTFDYQKTVAEGVSSTLHPNSYIELKYTPTTPPFVFGDIPINIESDTFDNNITSGSIEIPPDVTITEAIVTSYSGNFWSESVTVNTNDAFDLSDYNISYPELGDPFHINIPSNLLQAGSNSLDIKTASGPSESEISGGSPDDKIIYTMLIPNTRSYSNVADQAEGCNWFIEFDDGSSTTLKVPSDYNGINSCNFKTQTYNYDDAIDISTFQLLRELDLDDDGLLDINIDEQKIGAETLVVENIPSLWGPAVIEVRVWQ